jgi:hypothetical protein
MLSWIKLSSESPKKKLLFQPLQQVNAVCAVEGSDVCGWKTGGSHGFGKRFKVRLAIDESDNLPDGWGDRLAAIDRGCDCHYFAPVRMRSYK